METEANMTGWWKGRLLDGIWVLICIVASSIWCVSASARLSATWDEPTYLSLGLESWRTGSYKKLIDLGTMPLPARLQTLPLYLWERQRGEPFDMERDLERVLPIARFGTLPFWWLLLLYGWLSARQIAGVWGGRLAVLLLACEPNLLAHASLATTDVAVSACLLALFYHFRMGRDSSWRWRILIPAVWFALAVLSKASGFVFGILGLMMIEVEYRLSRPTENGSERPRFREVLRGLFRKPFRRDCGQICWLGLLLVFCFCGSEWLPSPSFIEWAEKLPEGPGRSTMVWLAEHLRIFSNAGVALVRQVRHNVQGHGVFLLERVEKRAMWYYFPVALSIKSPIPFLALPLLLAVVCRRALRNWACWLALMLLAFTLVCRVQIGIRLVLPLMTLAIVGLTAALVVAWKQVGSPQKRMLLTGSAALSAVWLLWASLSVWPNGLCYTNELWGGTEKGYLCLSDSNYDWGQGLKELARWQKSHHVDDLIVMYYGTDTSLAQLPMYPLKVDYLYLGEDQLPDVVRGHTFAVGISLVYGSVSGTFPRLDAMAHALRGLRPVDRTATFFIYRLPTKAAMTYNKDGLSGQ